MVSIAVVEDRGVCMDVRFTMACLPHVCGALNAHIAVYLMLEKILLDYAHIVSA